jgi:uncharacterized protein YbjQ (UPF0145 family)
MEQIIISLVLITLGYFFGRHAEKKHYKSIIEREHIMNALPAMASRIPPQTGDSYQQTLVAGNVVIANDYFKTFAAGLRNLFGGKVSSYESLLDRARREAVLRMKEEAQALQADFVFNVKYETTSISKGKRNKLPMIEVFAYGTALKKL